MFSTKKKKLTILFVGLDIKDMGILKSNKEFQVIYDIIEECKYKDYIQIIPALSIRRNQLRSKILKYRPQVLHFVGHGVEKVNPIFPEDKLDENSEDFEFELIKLFVTYKDFIQLIVFNTCESGKLAQKLKNVIDISIGTNKSVDDDGAISFADGFYHLFCDGDTIYNSFENGIEKYLKFYEDRSEEMKGLIPKENDFQFSYSARRDDYIITNSVKASNETLEFFIEINLWYDFLQKFKPEIQTLVQNLINLIISMQINDQGLFLRNLCHILEETLHLTITNKIVKNYMAKFDLIHQKTLIKDIIEDIGNKDVLFLIKIEDVFRKIIYILHNIIREVEFNSLAYNKCLSTYITHYLQKNPLFKNVKSEKLEDFYLKDITLLELLKENFNKVLREYKNRNYDEIFTSDKDAILEYCKNHLSNADLSSKYGYRYDNTFFIEDPKLELEFENFFNSLEDSRLRNRIFLLLGHMGLGKTWNACYLAFKYVEKIPTFYFHLGSSYETEFMNLIGGFDDSRIEKILENFEQEDKKLLLIFDGFDELLPNERKEFLSKLSKYINKFSNYLMVLLTSRLVDWINTEEISHNYRKYKQFIYNSERYPYYDDIRIFTGASYILSDIHEKYRLIDINEKYGINYNEVSDSKLQKLLKKPFIINLIFRNQINLEDKSFNPLDPEWFRLFADPDNEDTILRRMGIFDSVEKIFQELVCFIADPYNPIPEDDLKEFIQENRYEWDVIYSSGIIKKKKKSFQEEILFQEEYQEYVEKYITSLTANFHGNDICKADKFWLGKLEEELKDLGQNIKLQNITDFKDQENIKGYICNKNGRVIELRLYGFQLPYFPNTILKLLGLEKLDLKINKFVRIPEAIGKLRNLKNLNLSQNQIKNLPFSITGLESLDFLNLEYNKIERLDSWWHAFKKLEYVCIYNNRLDEKEQNQNPISIDYIDEGLNFKDIITPKYIQEKKIKELEYLYIKDAVVINYLFEEKKIHKEITYQFEFDDFRINSLKITNSAPLKSLFWSLERLETLELVNRSIQFGLNNSLKKLKLSVPNKFESNLSLEIHESVDLLKNLETLYIEGYKSIKYPDNLTFLSKINKLIIDTPKINEIPFFLLELGIYSNVIINSHSKSIDFNSIITNDKVKEPQILLTYNTDSSLPDLVIDESIKNLYLSTRLFSSKTIKIKGIIKKVIIAPIRPISLTYFTNGDLWRPTETGNYIFAFEISGSNIPNIESDFSSLTHFRLEHGSITNLSEWIFQSNNIKKLIITSETIPFTIQETFNEEHGGLFQLRVSSQCKIPEIENNLENITHFRINLPQLYRLPNFISNLSQFKQLVITSESLDNIIASFGTDEDKHRLLFRVANSCEFPRFLLQMKHLTHVWIDLPKLMKLPPDFELYFTDTKRIKFFIKPSRGESLAEYLEKQDPDYYVIKVHPNCELPIFDEQIIFK